MQQSCRGVLKRACEKRFHRACLVVSLMSALAAVGMPARVQADATNTPTPILTPTPTPACHEVPGHVDFGSRQVLPEHPVVGDAVLVHFDVQYFVYSVTRLQLQGASPLLQGETTLQGRRDATFVLTAVAAGTASLQLSVTYGFEIQCDGLSDGGDHTVTSPPLVVNIGGSTPTATPTSTPTCAPTGTPYCATSCSPCPTVREGCYASACGACIANPSCGANEACVAKPDPNIAGCCSCATQTPTRTGIITPTPTPAPPSFEDSDGCSLAGTTGRTNGWLFLLPLGVYLWRRGGSASSSK